MGFSAFLSSRRESAAELIRLLSQHYSYASLLGVDVAAKTIRADRSTSAISSGLGSLPSS